MDLLTEKTHRAKIRELLGEEVFDEISINVIFLAPGSDILAALGKLRLAFPDLSFENVGDRHVPMLEATVDPAHKPVPQV